MRISVESHDIKKGTPNHSTNCALARPIRRRLKGIKAYLSSKGTVVVSNGVEYGEVPLPLKAKDFMDRFDAGNDVKPISFDLPIEDVLKQVNGGKR